MSTNAFILADGFPPQLLVGVVAVAFWVLSNVFGKKNEEVSPPRSREAPDALALAAIRTRMAGNGGAIAPNDANAIRTRAKVKPKRSKPSPPKAVPPAATVRPVVAPPRPIATLAVPAASAVAVKRPPPEAARNVRLLLQRGGAREAFLLAEVLGPPKSSQ